MKRSTALASIFAFSVATLCLAGSTCAFDNPNEEKAATPDNSKAHTGDKSETKRMKKAGIVTRSSKLIGMNIENPQGQSLGEISDLVMNTSTGEVRYAAVTYGGFLGLGNKMFAVPFEAFNIKQKTDSPNEHTLILNVTQKQLEGATGFDEDHWPDFADASYLADINKRYDVKRKKMSKNEKRQAKTSKLDSKTSGTNVRVSQLNGMNIQNSQGKSVGEIKDIAINVTQGNVQYAAVTYGGFLGVGNKMFAVPFKAFKLKQNPEDPEEQILILNVTQQQLEGAQGFDEDHWPDFADPDFSKELHKRYRIDINGKDRDLKVKLDT
ncbi:PRC-barrel domain-containing protein [Gimesia algae]|uniref:PRC-barrel domain protein n=1 Tax=Gimesia algae TaxID=2527971 RepID=A0A517VB35_9PLAN|nr:PRC-barrel domain-containing protein [Gimesia algae]QDT90224.1 PRC-barrel domain protein [Gimesia algae]